MNKDGVLEKLCGYLGTKKNKNTKKIWWSLEHPVATGRQRKCDTISGRISCLAPNSRANTFHLYFDNDIMDKLVDCRNTRIIKTKACLQRSDNFNESSKYTWVKKTRWLIDYSQMTVIWCYNVKKLSIMSQISQRSHLLWQPTRKNKAVGYKFAAIREIWGIFNLNLSKYVAPWEYLLVDETLYPVRQQIAFRQYNPSKPHRYGLLLKSLKDARFPYIYKAVHYAVKLKAGDGLYYLTSTIDYIKYLVTKMETDQLIKGRIFSTDRLSTSIESTNWLLDRGIVTVGTLQKGRRGIPSELFETQNRDIFSATFHFEKEKKNIFLTPYTVKTKSKRKKNSVVLSTSRPLHGETIDDGKEKPRIITFYDFTKGGKDIVDQLNDYYTTRSKPCRWVMVALSYMLDTTRVNGKTVWCFKNDSDISSTSSYDFS